MRACLLPLFMCAALAGCSRPADPPKPPVPPIIKTLGSTGLAVPPDVARVQIDTSEGAIVLELDGKHAPISTANFLHYADTHKFENGTVYRAVKAGKSGFIQFNTGGLTYPVIPHEPTSQTGLSHTDGAVSMARFAEGTASNEFTIVVGDMTYLDAGGTAMLDKQGFAVFGHVVSGMETVKRILHEPTTKAAGSDILAKPVVITSVRRIG